MAWSAIQLLLNYYQEDISIYIIRNNEKVYASIFYVQAKQRLNLATECNTDFFSLKTSYEHGYLNKENISLSVERVCRLNLSLIQGPFPFVQSKLLLKCRRPIFLKKGDTWNKAVLFILKRQNTLCVLHALGMYELYHTNVREQHMK